jgi:hypothetical protein
MSGMKQLKKIIRKEWGISYKQIPKEVTLLQLAETIACVSEKKSIEEVYQLNLGHDELSLPKLIAFYIAEEMGWKPENVNATMTLGEIFSE